MSKKDLIPVLNEIEYIDQVKRNYEIRFCREDEIDEVVDFIRKYWKKDHIFVLSRELLDWQHHDQENHRYSIIMTKDKKTGEIGSILGAVKSSQYDSKIPYSLVWPSMWCSRNDISVKGLGISLYYYLKEFMEPEAVVGTGINPMTIKFYKSWGFEAGCLRQYYMINDDIAEFELIEVHDKDVLLAKPCPDGYGKIVAMTHKEFCALEEAEFHQYGRYKSKRYYINRYVKHPLYHYLFYKIIEGDRIRSVIVGRECRVRESCALRIVDYAGDYTVMEGTAGEWMRILKENHYEYVDFICRGVMENSLEKSGFQKRNDHEVVIPNYYEPFLRENIDLTYIYKTLREDADKEIVKGDADQDRPNMLL